MIRDLLIFKAGKYLLSRRRYFPLPSPAIEAEGDINEVVLQIDTFSEPTVMPSQTIVLVKR